MVLVLTLKSMVQQVPAPAHFLLQEFPRGGGHRHGAANDVVQPGVGAAIQDVRPVLWVRVWRQYSQQALWVEPDHLLEEQQTRLR